jgi:heme-degrading monooxygenase HmoA
VDGPIAALTRASIQLSKAASFWRFAPAAQASLELAEGCQLAVGLGEAPFLRQATFSVWDSVAAMNAYARTGAHLDAIRAAHENQYFSESLFVRFVPISMYGTWKNRQYGTTASPIYAVQ